MRIGWRHAFAVLAGGLIVGFAIVWLGLIDVRASTGHWRVTNWFLHFVMRASVETAAGSAPAPDLDDPGLLAPAAVHFEAGCAPCHGSPASPPQPLGTNILPPAPDLTSLAGTWSDAELFEIVKHGVRYTGMPAWPAPAHDDEVWATVAFLRAVPSMDTARYDTLAGQPASDELETAIAYCDRCHAEGRRMAGSLVPALSGQSPTYLAESLRSYRQGKRQSGMMEVAANEIGEDQIDALARHYSGRATTERAPKQATASPDTRLALAGEKLVTQGDAGRKIPRCATCHDGRAGNPIFPRLEGLDADYLARQLRLFASGQRGGTVYSHLMEAVARTLEDDDIAALSAYLARTRAQVR